MTRRRQSMPRRARRPFLESRASAAAIVALVGLMLALASLDGPQGVVIGGLMTGVLFVCVAGLVMWPRLPLRLIQALRRRGTAKRPPLAPSGAVTGRVPIPAGLRFAVLHRDGFRCRYCGRGEPDGVLLEIDHLVPVAAGGRNELDNLVVACRDCNRGKSARAVVGPDHAATPSRSGTETG